MRQHRSPVLFAFVAALAACGGDSSVSPANEPGLRFLSRAVADTIDAVVTDPVELQLNDDGGAPRANVAVDVTGPDVVGGTRLSPSLGAPSQRSLTVTTDAAGHARLWLRLGVRVGRQWVRATAGTAVDSLGVDILVGQPAQLVAAPPDTAIWVGQSYQLRARVLDRRNNQRDDPVSFATGGATSVSSTGVVSGAAIGRATLVASAAALRDTVYTSVVPQGVLAVLAVAEIASQTGGLYVLQTNGSGGRWVYRLSSATVASSSAASFQIGPFGLWPTWAADGNRLAFTQSSNLRVVEADGSGLRDVVVGGAALPVSDEFAPQYAKDRWIYFTRGQFGSQRTFWRVREDGSGLAQVSEQRAWGVESMPSPSPAGDVVAYQTNDVTNSPTDFTLRFISPLSGAIRKLDMRGYSPRWSPAGNRVAYLNGPDRLNLLDANGTPLGQVGGRSVALQQGFSWSPDGEWVVGVGTLDGLVPVLELVNVTSGLVLPLAFRGPEGQPLTQPSWQPAR